MTTFVVRHEDGTVDVDASVEKARQGLDKWAAEMDQIQSEYVSTIVRAMDSTCADCGVALTKDNESELTGVCKPCHQEGSYLGEYEE